MATQSFIIKQESIIIEAKQAVDQAMQGMKSELDVNEGKLYPSNMDCWGTLGVNARVLQSKLAKLIALIDTHR